MIQIGGEFEIDPNDLNGLQNFSQDSLPFLYANGRNALKSILSCVESSGYCKRIHLPFYICSSVVDTCRAMRFEVSFYELNNDFTFPLTYLSQIGKDEALLTVCYFGLVDDRSSVKQVKDLRGDICCISDHVMSFWTCGDSSSEFSFTSLRKHFAVPEGGLVYSTNPAFKTPADCPENEFYKDKLIGSLLKKAKVDDAVYLQFFKLAEDTIDLTSDMIFQSSIFSKYLFSKLDLEKIKKQRLKNAATVYEKGNEIGLDFVFKNWNEKKVPQHIPVWVKNGPRLRQELIKHRIYLPIHWPSETYNKSSSISRLMQMNTVSLVIDQRYDLSDMEFMVNLVYEINTNM